MKANLYFFRKEKTFILNQNPSTIDSWAESSWEFDDCISFQDYLKQEWVTNNTSEPDPICFWDIVDVRDDDSEDWNFWQYYYVGTIEWLHICTAYKDGLKNFLWCDNNMHDFSQFKQVRKHEEEKVTITITKSEYEKVKEFLNK